MTTTATHDHHPVLAAVTLLALAIAPYWLLVQAGLNTTRADSALWLAVVLAAALVLRIVTPRHAHAGLSGLVAVWLAAGAGPTESAVVVVWLLSTLSTGALCMRWARTDPDAPAGSLTEAGLVGTAIWMGIWGLMLHFPVNYALGHIALMLVPLLLIARRRKAVRDSTRRRAQALAQWMRAIPYWAWAAGLALIGWTLRWTSFPSLNFDDQAFHLRLWTDLATLHQLRFDFALQTWTATPFITDLLHGGLSLMAGADARGAMNLALATLLLAMLARVLHRLGLPPWVQWLLVVLMASTPLFGYLVFTLQTDLLFSLVCLAGMRLVVDAGAGLRGRHVLGVLAASALCVGIKLPGTVMAAMILLALAVRWLAADARPPTARHDVKPVGLVLLLPLAFVALHTYGLAWYLAGSPVFPLYNAIFLSPYYPPENFTDPRWVHGFSFQSYWRVFFETSAFGEVGNYTAGWQFLVLLPPALLALAQRNVPAGLRLLAIPVLGFGLVIFATTQYWRYLFPAMPMAVALMAALFVSRHRAVRVGAALLTVACMAGNFYFFPRVFWVMGSPASAALTPTGKDALLRRYAPVTVLTQAINQSAPGARVLYPLRSPYGATLNGSALYVNGYTPFRRMRFDALSDRPSMAKFLADERVDFVILDTESSQLPDTLLREHLLQHGTEQAAEGPFVLYALTQ